MTFFSELKRRNVVRVAIGYLAAAWFLVQIADTVVPAYGLPEDWVGILITVLSIGLVPVLIGTWLFELTPEGLKRDTGDVDAAPEVSHRNFDRVIMALLALAVGFFAFDKFLLEPERRAEVVREARQEGRVEAVLESYGDKSIVVLPFANLSPDPDQEYFADGLTEEMLNLLTQIAELRVISRSTAFTFKGKEIVVPEVAEKLNVSHVLEGSVRKAGNTIRVTAQLIEAATDTHLWSQTYDRDLEDIFAIQDDISSQVVSRLKLEMLGGAPQQRQVDPEAYELYLKAHHIIETEHFDRLDEAEDMLKRALEIQPDFVAGMGELARTYFNQTESTSPNHISMLEMRDRVRALVENMAEIAPQDSFTNTWQGFIASRWDGDYQAAARHYERAIDDDPFNPPALLRVAAGLLANVGKADEGLALARYNVSRDPACSICVSNLAGLMRGAGLHREAAERLEEILDWHQPTAAMYWNIGAAWLIAGEPQTALAYFDELGTIDPVLGAWARLLALYELGRIAEFEAEFEKLRERYPGSPETIARVYAFTGQNDEAFVWLERMVDELGQGSASLANSVWYEKLRSDPRMSAFLQKYGVSEEDMLHIEFDPPFPPALQAAIDRYRAGGG
jgi:adenylate cyclase